MSERVLDPSDPYCPKCGHNRDTSCVSSIDEGSGRKSCQMCGSEWSEGQQGARMKYEYIGEQSITLQGNGEAGVHMSDLPPLNPVPSMDLSQFHEGERAVSIMACENYARLYAQEAVRAEREANALRCDAEVVRLTEQGEPRAALVAGICAAAIRRGSV